MILYFQNSKEIEREIGKPDTYNEANEMIDKFLSDHNFTSYYSRAWKENDRYMFDVGSHTEFFILDTCGEIVDKLEGL